MRMRSLPARLALGAVLLTTATGATHDPFAGHVAGTPVECIDPTNSSDGPRIVDSHTIVYQQGRRLWRTGPTAECQSLQPNATLIIEQFNGSQLCHHDTFRVRQMGDVIASFPCQFTAFTPYDKR